MIQAAHDAQQPEPELEPLRFGRLENLSIRRETADGAMIAEFAIRGVEFLTALDPAELVDSWAFARSVMRFGAFPLFTRRESDGWQQLVLNAVIAGDIRQRREASA